MQKARECVCVLSAITDRHWRRCFKQLLHAFAIVRMETANNKTIHE